MESDGNGKLFICPTITMLIIPFSPINSTIWTRQSILKTFSIPDIQTMSTDGDQIILVEKGGQTQPLGPLIIKRHMAASKGTSLVIQMLTICRKRMQKIPWQRL